MPLSLVKKSALFIKPKWKYCMTLFGIVTYAPLCIQTTMNDINRKIDMVTKKQTEADKRFDHVDKRIVGLTRDVNKVSITYS